MLLRATRKGSTIVFDEKELKAYLEERLNDFIGVLSNGAMALTMISLIVVLTYFKAPEMAYFTLIAIPLLGRGLYTRLVQKWLRSHFKAILEA